MTFHTSREKLLARRKALQVIQLTAIVLIVASVLYSAYLNNKAYNDHACLITTGNIDCVIDR